MKKSFALIVSSAILLVLSMVFIFSYLIMSNDKIHENVFIDDTNVGKMTKDKAVNLVKTNHNMENIKLVYNEKIWNLNLQEIDFKLKVDKAVDEAYSIGRRGNYFENIKEILSLKSGNKAVIELHKEYNDNKLSVFLSKVEKDINKEPINASIKVANQKIYVSKDSIGYYLNVDKLKKYIEIAIANEDVKDIKLPVEEKEAEIKYDFLSKVNDLLGEFTTSFNSKVPGRTENIRLASERMNGIVLKPGEEFSFNTATGKRGLEDGFKMAPVIVQGELQEGVAGGVCQVSSTLYNAILYSGLTITERRNHSIPSSYADKGRDATVAYGSIDFKFKNNYDNPIYIENFVSGNNMVSRVYGNYNDKKNIQITTQTTETIPRETEIKEDSTLMKGKERILEKGRDGYKVSTYRNYLQNGSIIKQELISRSYYPPKKKIILKGTKIAGVKGEEISEVNSSNGVNPSADIQ